MAFHQLGEGGLGICFDKLPEQFRIGRHFQVIAPAKIKTAQEKSECREAEPPDN